MKFGLDNLASAFKSINFKSFGLTIAELIISTTVVGGIAVLTLGSVNNIVQTKAMNTQETLLNNDIAIALANMQSKEGITTYSSQNAAFNAFKKYYPVKEVISNDKATKFFTSSYQGDKTYKISDYPIKFINEKGESIALKFKLDYKPVSQFAYDQSSINKANYISMAAKNSAMGFIEEGVYDINGTKGPNKIGKDFGVLAKFNCQCNNTNLIALSCSGKCKGDYTPPDAIDCVNNPNNKECANIDCSKTPNDKKCYCLTHKSDVCCISPNSQECKCAKNPSECNKPNDCQGKNCPPSITVCTLTDDMCASKGEGFKLNKKTCECACAKTKAPKNYSLDLNTCELKCSIDYSKYSTYYADIEKSKKECRCVPKEANAGAKCHQGGGIWDEETCSCKCTDKKRNECKNNFCGYAEANETQNYCACTCKQNLFDNSKKDKIKSELNLTSETSQDYKNALNTTKYNSSIDNKCFTCSNVKNSSLFKMEKGTCVCKQSCAVIPSNQSSYPYFKFNDDVTSDNACKWTCDTEKLKELVNQLNKKYDSKLTPNIDSRGNNAYTNIQTMYLSRYSSDKSNNATYKFVKYLGKHFPNTRPSAYESTANKINDADFKMKYVADTANCAVKLQEFSASLSPASMMIDWYCDDYATMTYNLNNSNVHAHYEESYEYTTPCGQDVYSYWVYYTYENPAFRAPNPNTQTLEVKSPTPIARPQDSPSINSFRQNPYNDELWSKYKTGATLGYSYSCYYPEPDPPVSSKKSSSKSSSKSSTKTVDPLALNIVDNESRAMRVPRFDMRNTVNYPLYWNNNSYEKKKVYWPVREAENGNNYLFLVYNDYFKSGNQNVGYMFSDVRNAIDKEVYESAFEQLSVQVDKDSTGYTDTLINELDGKWGSLSLLSGNGKEKLPLETNVFEINTYYSSYSDESGNAAQDASAIYDLQGEFRRLAPIDSKTLKNKCKKGIACLVFDTRLNANDKNQNAIIQQLLGYNKRIPAELWYDYNDKNQYYLITPKRASLTQIGNLEKLVLSNSYKFDFYELTINEKKKEETEKAEDDKDKPDEEQTEEKPLSIMEKLIIAVNNNDNRYTVYKTPKYNVDLEKTYLIHIINNKYFIEFIAKAADIVFKVQN